MVERGFATQEQVQRLLERQGSGGGRLGPLGAHALGPAAPPHVPVLDELAFVTGKEVVPYLMLEMELADALDAVYTDAVPERPAPDLPPPPPGRSEEHTSELQSRLH